MDTSKYADKIFDNIVLDHAPKFIEKCVVGLARRIFKVLYELNDATERLKADLLNEDAAPVRYGLEAIEVFHEKSGFGYPATFMAARNIPTGYNGDEEIAQLQNNDEVYSSFDNVFYLN